jgi:hypothetical protein
MKRRSKLPQKLPPTRQAPPRQGFRLRSRCQRRGLRQEGQDSEAASARLEEGGTRAPQTACKCRERIAPPYSRSHVSVRDHLMLIV